MSTEPGVDALLAALQEAKLAGVGEVLRLRHLLRLEPKLDRAGLKRLVACVAVHSRAQAEDFERIFDAWFEQAHARVEREVGAAGAERQRHSRLWPAEAAGAVAGAQGRAQESEPSKVGAREQKQAETARGRRWWPPARRTAAWAAIGAMVVGAGAGGVWCYAQAPGSPAALERRIADVAPSAVTDAVRKGVGGAAPQGSAGPQGSAVQVPEPARRMRVPVLTVSIGRASRRAPVPWERLAAGAAAAAVAAGIWLGLRKRSFLPPPGPPDEATTPPVVRIPGLLDERNREALVWGARKRAGDRVTRALDVERSVRATAAAGGVPALRFLREGLHRTVWIWEDESTGDPSVKQLAETLAEALSEAGLPVARARYWAVPDRLTTADGATVAPHELDEAQAGAPVALLTDARALSIQYDAVDRRRGIDAALRALSRWSGLAFADFGEGRHGLAAIAAKHEIPVVRPEEVAKLLAEGFAAPSEGEPAALRLTGDALAWAAACALSPRPVDEATAFALAEALGLEVTAWTMRALRRDGRRGGGRGGLEWGPERRAVLLKWLASADGAVGVRNEVPARSLLGRALGFWRGRLAGVAGAEGERGLLDLWDRPARAAAVLRAHAHAGSEQEAEVRARLRGYSSRDWKVAEAASMELPWRLEALDAAVQAALVELGFGGAPGRERVALRRPGRVGLGIGVAAGLAVGTIGGMARMATGEDEEARVVIGVGQTEVVVDGVAPTCPEGMVLIPGGTFEMGSPEGEGEKDEHPKHEVVLDAYCMDRLEVTVQQYRRCVEEKKCTEPDKDTGCNWDEAARDKHPVNCVAWEQADTYCRWRGGRLPTEAEWEYGARGSDGRMYPWGDAEPGKQFCWNGEGNDLGKGNRQSTCLVGSYPAGMSPFGLQDMAGNVYEWCQDLYGSYKKATDPMINPGNPPEDPQRVLRGGSWVGGELLRMRAAFRGSVGVSRRNVSMGFRCARGPN